MWAEDIHQKRLCKSFYFANGLIVERKEYARISWMDWLFYPTTLQRTAFKKCLILMRNIIISSWCLWWAVNTIHLRCLFRMKPLVWCLRADVAAELRSLRRYYHLSNAWNRSQSIPAVYIVNWVQRWVTTCAWGTVWKWTLAEGGCAQRICRW